MRTTNLSRRSPLPDNTFLVYMRNRAFLDGRAPDTHNPYAGLQVGCGLIGLVGLTLILMMIFDGGGSPLGTLFGWGIGLLLVVIGGFLTIGSTRERQRLNREGWLLTGSVIEAHRGHTQYGEIELEIYYCFTTPEGQEIRKHFSTTFGVQGQPAPAEAPKPGTPVAVLYLSPGLYEIL